MLPPNTNIRKASGFTPLNPSNQKASIYKNKTKPVNFPENPLPSRFHTNFETLNYAHHMYHYWEFPCPISCHETRPSSLQAMSQIIWAFYLGLRGPREQQHPSAPRSVNEWPIHGPTGWKLQDIHIDPLLGWSIFHASWPKVNPIVHPTSYPTHIPFIPSESTLSFLSYSNFNIFTLKIQRSWVRSKFEVIMWV